MIDKNAWLAEKKMLLDHIHSYIDFYESEKRRLSEAVDRVEHMSKKGHIGLDEYDALMHRITQGHNLENIHCMYDEVLSEYKVLKEDTLMSIEWMEKTLPPAFKRESKIPYIMFLTFMIVISIGLFAGIAGGKTMGIVQSITHPDLFLFTVISGLILVIFFLFVKFAYKNGDL